MASEFTYAPIWSGTVYVAFMLDVFAQAIWQRMAREDRGLAHHSDPGSQRHHRPSQHEPEKPAVPNPA